MNQVPLMDQASLTLHNLRSNEQLQMQLSQCGFDAYQMKEGEKLIEEARKLTEQLETVQRQSKEASLSLKNTRKHIHHRYMSHLSIARVAFRSDVGACDALGLKGKRERSLEQWLKQTQDFYRNSSPYVEALQMHGVALHELDEIRILVGQLIQLASLQKQMQSRYQMLTQQKQETMELLKNWYDRLTRIARLALEDNPQRLEAIGIFVKA